MHILSMTTNLSDGSEVTDVILYQDGQTIRLPACSTDDASELITKLFDAITLHAVENVVVS